MKVQTKQMHSRAVLKPTRDMEKKYAPDGPSQERIERLLDVAEQVFLEFGYEGASVAKIAKLAGASKETFYARYASKADLFAAVMERCACNLSGKFDVFFRSGKDPEQALTELGLSLLDAILTDRTVALFRIVFSECQRFPELAQRFWEIGPGRGRVRLASYLQEQVDKGVLQVENTRIATEQYYGMLIGEAMLVFGLRLKPYPSPAKRREIVQSAVRVFLCYYRKQ